MKYKEIRTLAQLKGAGYKFKSIKEELRENLIAKLSKKKMSLKESGVMKKL